MSRYSRRHRERRYFRESVKRQKLREQNYKCAICKTSAGIWDYDHIDGNRSNNNPHNLQVLCPNCHAKKSRGLLKQEKRSSFLRWLKIGAIILFFIILIIIINMLWPFMSNIKKIQALSLAKDCYSMKLDLLTNATVVDDAIRFVSESEKSKDKDKEGE